METTDLSTDIVLGAVGFKQAKLEHYLQRAEEYLQMARFAACLTTLKTVYQLDPENSAAQSLQKRVEYFETSLHSDKRNGNENGRRRRRTELVMVVDQDERVLTSMVSVLRKYGFRAIGAGGYDEAVNAISKDKPDMIVSEVNFENGSVGYDLYLWIRMNVEMRELPFLFLATRIDRDTLIAGKRLGVTDFVLKPLDEELVVASILNCLARAKKSGA